MTLLWVWSRSLGPLVLTCDCACTEAKVRDQRHANQTADSELYCDDDISLKERLTRAETVSVPPPPYALCGPQPLVTDSFDH